MTTIQRQMLQLGEMAHSLRWRNLDQFQPFGFESEDLLVQWPWQGATELYVATKENARRYQLPCEAGKALAAMGLRNRPEVVMMAVSRVLSEAITRCRWRLTGEAIGRIASAEFQDWYSGSLARNGQWRIIPIIIDGEPFRLKVIRYGVNILSSDSGRSAALVDPEGLWWLKEWGYQWHVVPIPKPKVIPMLCGGSPAHILLSEQMEVNSGQGDDRH